MTHLLNLINMMIYLSNIAIFIDLPLRALKKHQTGPAGWFSCRGHWSIFHSVEQLSKKCWEKKEKNGTMENSIATLTTITLDQLCDWTTSQEQSALPKTALPKTVQVLLSKTSGRALQRWSIASTEGKWLSWALKCDKNNSKIQKRNLHESWLVGEIM